MFMRLYNTGRRLKLYRLILFDSLVKRLLCNDPADKHVFYVAEGGRDDLSRLLRRIVLYLIPSIYD